MTDKPRRGRGRRRRTVARDEFGGSEDGGLAIIVDPDQTVHVTPPRIATALRFLLARAQSGGQVLPPRIALTAALRGEGVTFLTRSLGSVLAYDTESTVAVVDLNWRLPVTHQPAKGGGKRKGDVETSPSATPSRGTAGEAGNDEAADVGDEPVDDADGGSEATEANSVENRDAGGSRQARNRRNANRRGRNRPQANARPAVASGASAAADLARPGEDSAPADSEAASAASPAARAPKERMTDATLADVLDGDADVADAIRQTTNPRLSLVTAGELALARRPAVAGGRALSAIIGEIAARFDHVLLDLPPVLASSDAIQLAKLSDVYALVVLQGVTPEHQIDAAIRELAGVESLGVVLNRFDSKVPKFLRRMVEA